ncbi:hypothetical protein Bca4012_063507 [Brassica carinata]
MSIVARNVQAYVPINLLEPSNETQKIRVKIINRWTLYNSKSGNSIELVLVDSSGSRLHAFIENDLVQKHRHLLNKVQALSRNAFSLKEYGGEFKTSLFPFKLAILRTTRTKELADFPDDVPEIYFIDFGDILDGKYERSLLIDVIGQIIEVGNVEEVKTKGKSNNSSKLQLILRDTNEVTLKCTLWGNHAKRTFAHTTKKMDSVVVCVMRFMSVKSYKGEISISNAFNATKILFDPNTEQADNFINSCNHNVQEYGEFSDDDGSQPKYNCKTCGDVNLVFPRYFLVVRANDYTDQTRFLIFDQIAENLLGKSADNLMREYDELDHIPVYSELLDSIVGKRVLFKVTLKDENNKFVNSPLVVDCVLDDEDMIDEWPANSSESLQLTSGEDCSESSFAEIQTPKSKKMILS